MEIQSCLPPPQLQKQHVDNSYTGSYQDYIPGLMDYVTYFPTIRALTKPGQMKYLYDILVQLPQNFLDVTLLGRFIENHDNPRFAGLTQDSGLRQSAFVFNILSDAIPIVCLKAFNLI